MNAEKNFTNHLINETSPYLLQHAHNPVNWYAWCEEALQKAKQEDKPILVSIGYSACHWCHVMEHESFEDVETADLMNNNFINIKIDREERPDLDHIYMDAVQAITGSGGWPLNVFLTPSLKPFYGGTYFPPVPAFNRSSWKQVLHAIVNAYQTKKNELEEQAESLTQYLLSTNNFGTINIEQHHHWDNELLNEIAENLLKTADKEWGGFGSAPKFPQTLSNLYLMRHFHFTGNETALIQAELSLDKMMQGGIYDQIGGGFARYSTDRRWQIPHFEKMLYDNALLIDVYTEAFQITQKKEYADVVNETIQFIKSEMTSAEGGFYSALDADSEGVEGKYYTWSKKEIDDLLGDDSKTFCAAYNVSDDGNWEHTNILWMTESLQTIATKLNLSKNELYSLIHKSKQILLKEGQKRIKPLLDTKIILCWNALMIKSLCKAYAAFGNEEFLNMAKSNIRFIEKNLQGKNGDYNHSWNKNLQNQSAFLDDYAALIQAYILLSEVVSNDQYLIKAKTLTEKVINDFSDEEQVFFYFTSAQQTDVILRKKEIYDAATPSGNAMMAENLHTLSLFFDIPEWKLRTEHLLKALNNFLSKHPVSFGYWMLNLQTLIKGLKEIVIAGKDHLRILKSLLKEYIPNKIVQSSDKENDYWPLLRGKNFSSGTYIYLCEDYSCLNPVENIENFKKQIDQNIFHKKSIAIK
ncbi:MAG TPA: thioredoxin domain-containing protein [Parafilimonas sp.]|nr:thioredoxin domain-containing protein [Parafilimonas sp.]